MIVVDASVINKIFLPNEVGCDRAQRIIDNHIIKKEIIIVPDILFYEVSNTLVTKSHIPLQFIFNSLEKLYLLNLEHIYVTQEHIKKAAKIAKTYHISVYDASYAVLAQEKKCDLLTADIKFVRQLNLPYIKLL